MRLHKTPKARDVLASQGMSLSPAERRILILCDGQRERADLEAMLGSDAAGSIQVLIAQGYLIADAATPAPAAPAMPSPATVASGLAGRLFGRLRESTAVAPPPAIPAQAPAAQQAAPPQPAPATAPVAPAAVAPTTQPTGARSRRSMPAAKMYMLDMLQLQRNVEAASIAVAIQTATGEQELADAFIEALACVRGSAKESVAARIAQRLLEVIPESQLGHVKAAWLTMNQPQLSAADIDDHGGKIVRFSANRVV